MDNWTPSDRQRERQAVRRQLNLRSALVATVAAVVVIGGGIALLISSPGWSSVRETFLSWDQAKASFPEIASAFFRYTVLLFLIAEPLILLVGILVAVIRTTTSPALFPLRALAVLYTDVFRGLPTLLVVILIGFGVPALRLQGVTTSPFWLALVALVLCYGAYVAEVIRSGIESIHPSQNASADALGLSAGQAMRFVVLPQAIRRVVPPLMNDFVSLQKDTALVSVIGVIEATRAAQIATSYSFNYTPLLVAGAFYLVLTIPLARFTDWLGRRYARRERAGAR